MKSINSKDIGKTDEEIVIEFFTKVLEKACENYVGEPTKVNQKNLESLVKKMQSYNTISVTYRPPHPAKYINISMGCHVKKDPCLICGYDYCEEDDCQLGVE